MAKQLFLAGVMQGSRESGVEDQSYRDRIRDLCARLLPNWEVYDPWEHRDDPLAARDLFFHHVDLAAASDALLAYLPDASMGTAVEMYAARSNGVPVYAISPLDRNWAVRFLSSRVFDSIEKLEAYLAEGGTFGV